MLAAALRRLRALIAWLRGAAEPGHPTAAELGVPHDVPVFPLS